MTRPATAHIRLDAFRHNYRLAKSLHGGKALAVVKANAYGHGAVQCAKAIADEVDGFAVACIEEALTLRQAGIQAPILLLEGFFTADELPLIVEQNLWVVIHDEWQIQLLKNTQLKHPIHVWLKMDTGMHRVGLAPSQYAKAYNTLSQHANVASITAMSHFANADKLQSDNTQQQLTCFQQTIQALPDKQSINGYSLANSAAILGWPQTHTQWARPGIMLYGASPMSEPTKTSTHALRPVMQLTSRIISIRNIKKGDVVGYGSLFKAERDTVVGVVACGYADGYPRAASGRAVSAPVAVDGKITKVIGCVSMDMLFVDLTDIPQAIVGSQVELWGNQIPASAVASAAGTIAYELFCNVKRVQFVYLDKNTDLDNHTDLDTKESVVAQTKDALNLI